MAGLAPLLPKGLAPPAELPLVLQKEFSSLVLKDQKFVLSLPTADDQLAFLEKRRKDRRRAGLLPLLICWGCVLTAAFLAIIIGLSSSGGATPQPPPVPTIGPPTAFPTTAPTTPPTAAPTLRPTPPPIPCPADDAYSYPGSPWLGAQPNSMGSMDYNCDGVVQWYALCGPEGSENVTVAAQNSYYPRIAGPPSISHDIAGACGACPGGGHPVAQGYECKQGMVLNRRKRYEPACPEGCADGVTAHVRVGVPGSLPAAGDCAMRVTHCLSEIDGGDGEECCIIVGG